MKRFTIILATILSAFMVGCINGGQKASINDLQLTSGFRDRKLMLEGTEGVSSTFSFIAKHDWSIIDYKGFSCNPSSGAKSENFEEIRVIATPLWSNNSADTIRLSDLNFKLLSTRFVGISAYQLPQIRLPKGDKINLDAKRGAKGSLLFVSSNDDVELVAEGEISASLGEKNEKNEYTLTVTATEENLAAEDRKIGTIGFKVGGVMQESKIEVKQISAIVLDRREVLLPSREGGENIFVVDSDFEVNASTLSDKFDITTKDNKTFTVRSKMGNSTSEALELGEITISVAGIPECSTTIKVRQRKAKASQTIIVQFIGTALNYYFEQNINKMLEALSGGIQGDAQVMVLIENNNNGSDLYNATLYELRYDATLGKAVKDKIQDIIFLPSNGYDSALFDKNLSRILNFAPAEKYALVIGSHGLGWVPKTPSAILSRHLMHLGLDPATLWKRNENAEMTRHLGDKERTRYNVEEIASAIEKNNIKFDYILFDACFMGNVESAYAMRNVADYIIGSPCEVMGYGFPYAKIMQYMLQNGGTSYDLDKICSGYVNYYKTEAVTKSACVALTKCSELEALAQAMKEVNGAGVKSGFSLDNVQYYEGQNPHSFYDLGDMVEQSCADATVAATFKKQLDKTVTSRYHTDQFYSAYGSNGIYYHDVNYYSGISTSAMVEHYTDDWSKTEWYKATH